MWCNTLSVAAISEWRRTKLSTPSCKVDFERPCVRHAYRCDSLATTDNLLQDNYTWNQMQSAQFCEARGSNVSTQLMLYVHIHLCSSAFFCYGEDGWPMSVHIVIGFVGSWENQWSPMATEESLRMVESSTKSLRSGGRWVGNDRM